MSYNIIRSDLCETIILSESKEISWQCEIRYFTACMFASLRLYVHLWPCVCVSLLCMSYQWRLSVTMCLHFHPAKWGYLAACSIYTTGRVIMVQQWMASSLSRKCSMAIFILSSSPDMHYMSNKNIISCLVLMGGWGCCHCALSYELGGALHVLYRCRSGISRLIKALERKPMSIFPKMPHSFFWGIFLIVQYNIKSNNS